MRASILQVPRADVAIAAVVAALTIIPTFLPDRQPWWVVVLAALTSVPVLWRRRAVLTVGAIVGLAMTILAATFKTIPEPPLFLLPYGVLVCVYTFADEGLPALRRALGGLLIVVGVGASLIVPHEDLETSRYLITAIVAAYAAGVGVRARRAGRIAVRERERRIREERAAAVERERTRIARDMHDIVTHSVGVMVVQAEAGPLVVRGDPARAEAAFEAIAETGRDAVGQLRLILGALRGGGALDGGAPYEGEGSLPAAEEPAARRARPGLAAVPGLVDNARKAGLDAVVEMHGTVRKAPADVDIAAYRIVQEALTNTIRHAAARTVRVRVGWTDDALHIDVADDGRGARGAREGHGMIGMRERVAACRGTVDFRTAGAGFAVAATLPIR